MDGDLFAIIFLTWQFAVVLPRGFQREEEFEKPWFLESKIPQRYPGVLPQGGSFLTSASWADACNCKHGKTQQDTGKESGKMMMGSMHNMMMHEMMSMTIIATSDGGVIVATGNKLFKYDKNLNFVKEVDIKIDMEGIHKQMMDMIEKCPMMQGMGDMKSSAEESSESAEEEKAGHESHHPLKE